MRYAYGLTAALLVSGAALSLSGVFPAGAQTAQNEGLQIERAVPRAGAPESFANLTEQLQPAVVNISTRQRIEVQARNPFAGTPFAEMFSRRRGGGDRPVTREAQSLGSGFIVSADGYVVTNNHVVSPNDRGTVEEITVTLPDGKEYEANLVGADAESDLAVLKVDAGHDLPFVKFGDSKGARVGDWVIAIGNPFGLGGTVTSGIVSSVLRNTGGGAYDRFIQTDASINRGNSGGPLFDMQGNVIGINNAIISPTGGSVGIGFAIPAETAAPIVEKLRSGTEIERGYLGVSIQPVSDDLAASLGLEKNRGEIVQLVQDGKPADKAGIQAGDVVLSVNKQDVTPDQTLSFLVANIAPGKTIPIELIRKGKRQTVNVTVGKRPSTEELSRAQMFGPDDGDDQPDAPADNISDVITQKLGLGVVAVDEEIARQLGIDRDSRGLAIAAVDPNSDAARKGLRRRDVIVSANYRPVETAEQLEAVISKAEKEGRNAVALRIQRRGSPAGFIAVRIR